MTHKTTYLREQCEQIELLHNDECMDPMQREVMSVNHTPVLPESEDVVTFDWVNELYNHWLKVPPATPYIDTTTMRSHTSLSKSTAATRDFHQQRSIETHQARS